MKKALFVLFLLFALGGCTAEYNVSFESNGGSAIDSIVIEKGTEFEEPDDPTMEGYTFKGWYIDSEFETEFDFDTPLTEDIVLYAKWEQKVYSIFFLDYDGSVILREFHHAGDDISDSGPDWVPYREGYLFLDWDKELPDIMPTQNITLTAQYSDFRVRIAVMMSTTNEMDTGFSLMILDGATTYAEENLSLAGTYLYFENSTEGRILAMEMAIELGAEIIICPGYLYEVAVYEIQDEYPDISFLILDGAPHSGDYSDYYSGDNTYSVTFDELQIGFLAGYAAVRDGKRDLGFIGGMAIPAVIRYGSGFIQGAEYAATELGLDSGEVTIRYYYANTFSPDDYVENLVEQWYSEGTEVIFSACGTLAYSIIAAAENMDGLVIATDFDMGDVSDTILTSALKNYAQVVYDILVEYYENDGEWTASEAGQVVMLTAAENAVCLDLRDEYWRFDTFTKQDYESFLSFMANGYIDISDSIDALPSTISVIVEEE